MKSAPPESDISSGEGIASAAVTSRPRERAHQATDFHSLHADFRQARKLYEPRGVVDYLCGALTPVLIFLMVYAVIFFLLDIRFVYTEVHDGNFRFVALCFLVGIVALNRLIAKEGSDESILYFVALAGAIGLYTLATTGGYDVGSVARNFMNSSPWIATAFNMVVVALVWWATNRLMHECCVDENPEAGDIGMLTSTARRFQKAIAPRDERRRREEAMKESRWFLREGVDPTQWKEEKPKRETAQASMAQRLPKRHPGVSVLYFSVPALCVFALGLRVVQHGGERMVMAGHFYLGLYTASALLLLLMTSLGGLTEYFRARRTSIPAGLGWFWLGLGMVMVAMVMVGAARLPKPSMPPVAHIDEHMTDYWSRNSTFRLITAPAAPAEILEHARFLEHVGTAALIGIAAFLAHGLLKALGALAAAIGRRRDVFPRPVRRFFEALDGLLQRLTQMPTLPKFHAAKRLDQATATCMQYSSPMGNVISAQQMTVRDMVEYSYEALCSLAFDLGVPRPEGDTPYEFIAALPKELDSLRDEATELPDLFVRAAYSDQPLDAGIQDRLRKFWRAFDHVRRFIVR
ncbi:MAG TPA: DUF4129 domain-containing protein [Candidatus Hydrogenedentes bacterium]|nr:DUF4129 domain-containing protein [Candidatus Hydrogenedentota bacterium]